MAGKIKPRLFHLNILFFDKGRQGADGPFLPLKSLPTPKLPDALLPCGDCFSDAALIRFAFLFFLFYFI